LPKRRCEFTLLFKSKKEEEEKTYEKVGLLAELSVVLADEGVGCVVLGSLYFDAAALNV